jgi:hypothetical protein
MLGELVHKDTEFPGDALEKAVLPCITLERRLFLYCFKGFGLLANIVCG